MTSEVSSSDIIKFGGDDGARTDESVGRAPKNPQVPQSENQDNSAPTLLLPQKKYIFGYDYLKPFFSLCRMTIEEYNQLKLEWQKRQQLAIEKSQKIGFSCSSPEEEAKERNDFTGVVRPRKRPKLKNENRNNLDDTGVTEDTIIDYPKSLAELAGHPRFLMESFGTLLEFTEN